MKTSKLFAMAVSVIVLGATAIFGQQPNGEQATGTQVHQMYVDENGDGINDNMRNGQHQSMHNGGTMHGQNHSGAGHQNGGQGMHSGNQGMHGMMDGQNHSRMGHQGGSGYHGGMNSSSGMGSGHGSNGMGRH